MPENLSSFLSFHLDCMPRLFFQSILSYNGGAVIAMKGKECVAVASDLRYGVELRTVTTDFPVRGKDGEEINDLMANLVFFFSESVRDQPQPVGRPPRPGHRHPDREGEAAIPHQDVRAQGGTQDQAQDIRVNAVKHALRAQVRVLYCLFCKLKVSLCQFDADKITHDDYAEKVSKLLSSSPLGSGLSSLSPLWPASIL